MAFVFAAASASASASARASASFSALVFTAFTEATALFKAVLTSSVVVQASIAVLPLLTAVVMVAQSSVS